MEGLRGRDQEIPWDLR